LQSTKEIDKSHDSEDYFPSSPQPNNKSKEVCYAVYESNDIAGYMDLTGRFPKISSSGNQYILVGYNYDSNYKHAEPIKIGVGIPSLRHGKQYITYLKKQQQLQLFM